MHITDTQIGRAREWLGVRLLRWRLDRELADGFPPEGSALRALRAEQLIDPVTRRKLAICLRRAVADAEHPRTLHSAVPLRRAAILDWQEGLVGLAERLERPVRVNACGVARTTLLLTDGASPLYNPTPAQSLGEMIWWIADGLHECPPHHWGCPVVSKLDPEHVSWTCSQCGQIAQSDDPAVRPA